MKWQIITIIMAGGAFSLAGCAAEDTAEADQNSVPDIVVEAAEVARAIAQNPAVADSILDARGMTRERLDSLMFEIAMDPQLTEAFEAARR